MDLSDAERWITVAIYAVAAIAVVVRFLPRLRSDGRGDDEFKRQYEPLEPESMGVSVESLQRLVSSFLHAAAAAVAITFIVVALTHPKSAALPFAVFGLVLIGMLVLESRRRQKAAA